MTVGKIHVPGYPAMTNRELLYFFVATWGIGIFVGAIVGGVIVFAGIGG